VLRAAFDFWPKKLPRQEGKGKTKGQSNFVLIPTSNFNGRLGRRKRERDEKRGEGRREKEKTMRP